MNQKELELYKRMLDKVTQNPADTHALSAIKISAKRLGYSKAQVVRDVERATANHFPEKMRQIVANMLDNGNNHQFIVDTLSQHGYCVTAREIADKFRVTYRGVNYFFAL